MQTQPNLAKISGYLSDVYTVSDDVGVIGVFSTEDQASAYIEKEVPFSNFPIAKRIGMIIDNNRVCLIDTSSGSIFRYEVDYPELRSVVKQKILKAQALNKLSDEERKTLGLFIDL